MKTIILKNEEVECLIRRILEDRILQRAAELKVYEARFESLKCKAISESFDSIEEELEFDSLPEIQQVLYWELKRLEEIVQQL